MRTLLVDNHDSYTYNVFHLLAGVSGEEPIVVDNDAVSWRALERWNFDAIVLSPGPGTPGRWHDFCVCDDILRFSEIPVPRWRTWLSRPCIGCGAPATSPSSRLPIPWWPRQMPSTGISL